jgi:hypothetical protein
MYTKICNIVNNTRKKVTPEFVAAFEKEYRPSYKSKEYYGYSVLEFIFKRYGIAIQENYQHDSIFMFAPNIKIDWKRINPKYGTASINANTYDYDSTHYGFINIHGNPFKIGDVLSFELVSIEEKDYVWNNKAREFQEYFTFFPKKRK